MRNVPAKDKRIYMTDGVYKVLKVKFPAWGITITNENIVHDSFSLDESIMEGSNLEFVGCVASKMEVTVADIGYNFSRIMKGAYVEVEIQAFDDYNQEATETTTVFKGYVDSAKKSANKKQKHIVAYDPFCRMQDIDVTDLYNSSGHITINELFGNLMNYIRTTTDMNQLTIDPYGVTNKFINGWYVIDGGATKRVSNLSAISLLKSICQINGVFGYFDSNKYGLCFCVMQDIKTEDDLVRPSEITYPAADLYPVNGGGAILDDFYFEFYKDVEYDDYRVAKIDSVVIRKGSEEYDVWVGDGRNRYIVRNNLFMETATDETKQVIAQNLLNTIGNINYVPFTSDNNGCPFIQVGDEVSYNDIAILDDYKRVHFIVFSRTLKGDQNLRDTYSAEGDEYQHEFITEVNVNIADVESRLDEHDREIKDLQDALDEYGGGWRVEVVDSFPTSPAEYTLYLVRGRAYDDAQIWNWAVSNE